MENCFYVTSLFLISENKITARLYVGKVKFSSNYAPYKACSELCRIPKMEFFEKIVNGF